MIISYKLRVIYIKLKKVASSSFEVALSKYCGPNDVIAPMTKKKHEEELKVLGYPYRRNQGEYKNHDPADIWNNYTKIATLRNPYERMISRYYEWMILRNRRCPSSKKKTFKQYIERKNKEHHIADFLYGPIHIEGKSVLDYCIRYEHLAEDIKALEVKINCPGLYETMQSFSFNAEFRPNEETSLYEMYTKYPEAKSMRDEDLYESWDKYELLREHWPKYQSELEEILAINHKKDYITENCQ